LGLASVEEYAMEIICVRGTPPGEPFLERASCRRHAPAGHLSFCLSLVPLEARKLNMLRTSRR
jgi:hypothetical protein